MTDVTISKVYGKIAWRLIPLILLCYVLAQLNRFNISFAKHQFLPELGLDDAVFGVAVSAFYVGYIVFQLPAGFFLSRFGIDRFLLAVMVAWGTAGCMMAFASNATDFYLLRFLLGAAQAGFFPGMIFFLSCWFPDGMRGRINTLFISALPLASILAGPLAGWIMGSLDGVGGLRGWQWLFLLEGLPAIFLGMLAYKCVTNRPDTAAWLTDREKDVVAANLGTGPRRVVREAAASSRTIVGDPVAVLLGFVYFGYFCALNAYLLWTPSLLRLTGLEDITSIGMVSGLAALVSVAGMQLIGMNSDRRGERRWHVALCGLTVACAYLFLPWAAGSIPATVALLMIAGTGLYAMLGLFWTIPASYLTLEISAKGFAFINMFGVFGGVVSPTLVGWISAATGRLHLGIAVVAGLLAVSMVTLLVLTQTRKGRTSI